ncbi:unnamed protein product [Ilex paraguariensis]|uniref:Uncharacterized protein n=1 Tax=Ilex paraguariensis TaxID=185542 RepID=A0ABC8SHB7_9AQUA
MGPASSSTLRLQLWHQGQALLPPWSVCFALRLGRRTSWLQPLAPCRMYVESAKYVTPTLLKLRVMEYRRGKGACFFALECKQGMTFWFIVSICLEFDVSCLGL